VKRRVADPIETSKTVTITLPATGTADGAIVAAVDKANPPRLSMRAVKIPNSADPSPPQGLLLVHGPIQAMEALIVANDTPTAANATPRMPGEAPDVNGLLLVPTAMPTAIIAAINEACATTRALIKLVVSHISQFAACNLGAINIDHSRREGHRA
jgi:hypothetical protein